MYNKGLLFLGLVLIMVLVCSCEQIDFTKISGEDVKKITEQVIVCKNPYMRHEAGCCLDINNNSVCDKDEELAGVESQEIEKERTVTNETEKVLEETPKELIEKTELVKSCKDVNFLFEAEVETKGMQGLCTEEKTGHTIDSGESTGTCEIYTTVSITNIDKNAGEFRVICEYSDGTFVPGEVLISKGNNQFEYSGYTSTISPGEKGTIECRYQFNKGQTITLKGYEIQPPKKNVCEIEETGDVVVKAYKDACSGGLTDYPNMFVKEGQFDGFLVVSEDGSAQDNLALRTIAASMKYKNEGNVVAVKVVDATRLDSEIKTVNEQNLISIGYGCLNIVTNKILGGKLECENQLTPGEVRIKLIKHPTGKYSMLVMAVTAAEIKSAGDFIANNPSKLSGTEVVIKGIIGHATTKCLD